MASVAQALTDRMDQLHVTRSKDSIYTIISDDHNVHCITADMLDAWWASLPPEQKAIYFEADLEGYLYETAALAESKVSEFQAHVDRFFDDMQKLHKSPFTGLTKEVAHADL
ncbi:MAG: hypothetical protein BGO25_05720 [Acidobacteriales bacterium 59-55]|nr:hypothetical protein [Terriglobales bacterium]ODU54621.1 MAG: hypothetical protein ABT04_02500 [Granulicella sp. SCN 62-9]OJV44581.1 MAG: hypothetical protein BGO25_05720 [Acidobacteriales bacterium 59-55]